MRQVLMTVAGSDEPVRYGAFMLVEDESAVKGELRRLDRDGLIESSIAFQNGNGYCMGGTASITEEGREFLNLIENDRVWELMRGTLDAAGIDVPYPLLNAGPKTSRCSTEPLIRVMVEASSADVAQSACERVAAVVEREL